ncbi:MAG: mechanosensitive ion channel domain-containing protein [Gemmatimonadota bacterium]|jgi:small-conductance mechanosensitive channel
MGWPDSLERWFPIFDVPLFRLGNTTVTVATLVTVLIIVVATLIVTGLVGRWMDRMARGRHLEAAGSVAVTARLVHYTILLIGFGIALHTAGVDLTALFAASAIFGVIVGFAMQNIASNFVSGVILLFERTIKPGDILEVDGRFVTIKELGIRCTIARSLNEEDLIIPNNVLIQATVKNYTLRDSLYRIDAPVGVVYGSDMALVRSTLEKAIKDLPWRSQQVEPAVLMAEFGDSSVNFSVAVWIEMPWKQRMFRSQLNETIWWALKNAGITIAFPQLDVHFDPEIERSMTALAQA